MVEYSILEYIMQDIKTIVEDGMTNDINDFPMTKVLSAYIRKNNLSVEIIDGIIYDILIQEYVNYIEK